MASDSYRSFFTALLSLIVHLAVSACAAVLVGVDVPSIWQVPAANVRAFDTVVLWITHNGAFSEMWPIAFLASSVSLGYLLSRGPLWSSVGIITTVGSALAAPVMGRYYSCVAFNDCHAVRVENAVFLIALVIFPSLLVRMFFIILSHKDEDHKSVGVS